LCFIPDDRDGRFAHALMKTKPEFWLFKRERSSLLVVGTHYHARNVTYFLEGNHVVIKPGKYLPFVERCYPMMVRIMAASP